MRAIIISESEEVSHEEISSEKDREVFDGVKDGPNVPSFIVRRMTFG